MKKSDRGPQIIRAPGSNIPIPVGRDTDLATRANECLETVAREVCPIVNDLDDLGKSYLEVAINNLARAATYDADARTEFLDRVMGKPKQRVDSTSVTVNLTDFLHKLVEEEKQPPQNEVIDGQSRVSDDEEVDDGLSILR